MLVWKIHALHPPLRHQGSSGAAGDSDWHMTSYLLSSRSGFSSDCRFHIAGMINRPCSLQLLDMLTFYQCSADRAQSELSLLIGMH